MSKLRSFLVVFFLVVILAAMNDYSVSRVYAGRASRTPIGNSQIIVYVQGWSSEELQKETKEITVDLDNSWRVVSASIAGSNGQYFTCCIVFEKRP